MITVNKKTMNTKRKTFPQRVDMTGDIAFSSTKDNVLYLSHKSSQSPSQKDKFESNQNHPPGSVEEKLEKLLQKYPDNEQALLLAKKLKARRKMSKEQINYTISPRFEHKSYERSLGSISKLNIQALHGSNDDTQNHMNDKANYVSRSNIEQKDHLTDLFVNCKEGMTDKSLNEINKETVFSTNKFICETNTTTSRVGELLEYIEEKYGNRESINPVSEHPIDDYKMEGSKPSTELQYNNSYINASSKIIHTVSAPLRVRDSEMLSHNSEDNQSETSLKENGGKDDQQSLRGTLNGIKNGQSGVKQNTERQTVRSCKLMASERIVNIEKRIMNAIPIDDKIIKVYPPVQKRDSKMRVGNTSTTKKKISPASSRKYFISCSMKETRKYNTNNAEDIADTTQNTNNNNIMVQKNDMSERRGKKNILLNKKQFFGSEADYQTVVSILRSDATEDTVSKLLVPVGFAGEKKDGTDDELRKEDGSDSKNINQLSRLCILLGIIFLIVIGILGLGVILGFVAAKLSK